MTTPLETLLAAGERLNALTRDRRPFRFRDTTRAEAERYMARNARFEGCSAEEIATTEAALGVTFTDAMRGWFMAFGRAHGQFFTGSDLARLEDLVHFRARADAMLRFEEAPVALPDSAVVFMAHQGYVYYYQEGDGGPDAPVCLVTEGPPWQARESPGLLPVIESAVNQLASLFELQHAQGGYWLTIRDGMVTHTYPKLSEGPFPIELGDRFAD